MSTHDHRGSRCGECYWALYDGDWCQNPDCLMKGQSVGENQVRLSNWEAAVLIEGRKKKKYDSGIPATPPACRHPRTRFVQSASGNESWYECTDCGAELPF